MYMQSTGTFYAAARYGSATPVPPSVISRGAGWIVGFTIFCNSLLTLVHETSDKIIYMSFLL